MIVAVSAASVFGTLVFAGHMSMLVPASAPSERAGKRVDNEIHMYNESSRDPFDTIVGLF